MAQGRTLDQSTLINALNRFIQSTQFRTLGIELNHDGICSGLVALYLMHKAKATEDKFFQLIEKINSLKQEDYVNEKSWLTDFIQKAQFAFNPAEYDKSLNQKDLNKFLKDPDGTITEAYSISFVCARNKLNELFKNLIHRDEMIYLSSQNHAIAVYKKFDEYFLYDPNQKTGEQKYKTIEELSAQIQRCFFLTQSDQALDLSAHVFNYRPHIATKIKGNTPTTYPDKKDIVNNISPEHIQRSLYLAVVNNDTTMVLELLKKGANPFQLIEPNRSIFTYACTHGYIGAVTSCIKQQIQQPTYHELAFGLHGALMHGRLDVSEFLIAYLQQHFSDEFTKSLPSLFINACRGGNIALIKKIMSLYPNREQLFQFKDGSGNTALAVAAQESNGNIIKFILENYPAYLESISDMKKAIFLSTENKNFSAYAALASNSACHIFLTDDLLRYSIKEDKPRIVKDILSRQIVSVSYDHIILAAENYNMDMLNTLLNLDIYFNQADLNKLINIKLALIGDQNACKKLASEDASLAQNILIAAATNGNVATCKMLLVNGITLSSNNDRTLTLLIKACEDFDEQAIKTLLLVGVNPQQPISKNHAITHYQGKSPLEYAALMNPDAALIILRELSNLDEALQKRLMIIACKRDLPDIAAILIQKFGFYSNLALDEKTPFQIATDFGSAKVLNSLLANQATPWTLEPEKLANLLVKIYQKNSAEFTDITATILQRMLQKNIDIKKIIPPESVNKGILSATKRGFNHSIATLLLIHKPPIEILNQALLLACQHRHVETANTLIAAGAKLEDALTAAHIDPKIEPIDHQLSLLYELFQCDNVPKEKRTFAQILQLARLYDYPALRDALLDNTLFLKSLEAYPGPNPELNIQIQFFDKNKLKTQQRLSLFHFDLENVINTALADGDIKLVTQLLSTKKLVLLPFDINKKDIFITHPIAIASRFGHRDLLRLLLNHVANAGEVSMWIFASLQQKNFTVAAALLENLPLTHFTAREYQSLLPYQADLRQAYLDNILYSYDPETHSSKPRPDAKERQADTRDEKNALGKLLHMPTSESKSTAATIPKLK